MNKDEEEYEVIVQTRDSEYEYDISVAKKVHENQLDNNESKKYKQNPVIKALISISLTITVVLIIIGIFLNIEIIILYGTLISLAYCILTSNFFKKYDKEFYQSTGTTLDNRAFICKLSIGIGAVGFFISNFILDHMPEFMGNGNELLTLGINILMVISLILMLFDANSKDNI